MFMIFFQFAVEAMYVHHLKQRKQNNIKIGSQRDSQHSEIVATPMIGVCCYAEGGGEGKDIGSRKMRK